MAISYKELLSGHTLSEVPIAHQHNGEILLERINKIREAYGKPMIVTSGYRSMQDHLRIYSQIAAKKGIAFDTSKVPMRSRHLTFEAVDILDMDGKLMEWCRVNEKLLEDLGLWLEDDPSVPRVHFQIKPYPSWKPGKSIFFKP